MLKLCVLYANTRIILIILLITYELTMCHGMCTVYTILSLTCIAYVCVYRPSRVVPTVNASYDGVKRQLECLREGCRGGS